MCRYLKYVTIFCLVSMLALFDVYAEGQKARVYDKPFVPDSILKSVFQFSPFYSRIVDEYKADVYMKQRIKVHKSNKLIRYIPSMFRFEKGVNEYLLESMSEMHYTAPDIYNRKVKAMSGTLPRNRGQLTDLSEFLNMNVYSSSMMKERLLSPLDEESSKYYTYLLDTIVGPSDAQQYKIRIVPKFRGTQLVSGYMWVSDQVWTIREIQLEGKFDMIQFTLKTVMGEDGPEEFLPVRLELDLHFKFMGNHLEANADVWMKYDEVAFYEGGPRRKSQKKHHHDLTEFYRLECDTSQVITDKDSFQLMRPIPLLASEDSLYRSYQMRRDTLQHAKAEKENAKTKSSEFWGQVGDMLVTNYNVNISGFGSVKCSPLINPVMLDYSHSRGVSYKQKFKYSRLFPSGRMLKITPQMGYNFKYKEFYLKGSMSYLYWPEKLGAFEASVGNGNRIYSSVVLDKLQALPDSLFSFNNVELDYFKDIYLNVFHSIEPVNGLLVKVGASMHWRSLADKGDPELKDLIWPQLQKYQIRSNYNSFSPRIRLEWTPGLYYYMNGRRKMNVGSSMPTFILDYEHGLKGVLGSNDEHERWELDVQQKIKLNQIRTIGYRLGCGMFTKMDHVYFVDFVNFSRRNIPEGWNDEIGGTFQLLDRRWFNSSRQYWRGHVTYESPFILLRPLNRLLGMIQQERLYGGVLFMPHLNPYIEVGYGIGTHVFDVGAFVSTVNGKFGEIGFKFTFELFND